MPEGANPQSRVMVLGDLYPLFSSPVLQVNGPYEHGNLRSLAEDFRPNIGLIPSICPETFCYAAQEIIMLGLPLICLDLGAQARQAREYPLGMVTESPDAAGCLEAIEKISGNFAAPPGK